MKKLLLLYFLLLFVVTYTSAQKYELDNSYLTGTGFNGNVNVIKLDQNGKAMVGGNFTNYNGANLSYLVRVKTDGTVDYSFSATVGLSATVDDIAIYADPYDVFTVVTGGNIKRLKNDGALFDIPDFTMRSTDNAIYTVAHAGPSIIFGGNFTDFDGNSVGRISKMDADGSPDATFIANTGTGFNDKVRTIEVMASGQLLVGGDFSSFNGVTRNRVAILNSNGTLYTPFNPGTTLSTDVYAVAEQGDGKILAGSSASSSARLIRFNDDGTLDNGFSGLVSSGGASIIENIYTSGTDDIIVGGSIPNGIAKLDYTDGSLITIAAGYGFGALLPYSNDFVVTGSGAIIVGGDFNEYNGLAVSNIARIAECTVSIDTQPSTAAACETNNASFTVVASGAGTIQYQWQENTTLGVGLYSDVANGGVYSGVGTATLTLTNVTSGMQNYRYRCVVTDDDCSSTTNAAILSVNTNQVLTTDPDDAIICDGKNAVFSVSFTGTSGGFQWQEDPGTGFSDITNGGIYSGATTNSLSLTGVSTGMSGYQYRLKSTLCSPSGIFSASATLTVNEAAVITESPVDAAVCVSGDASFTVAATSGSAITYQWQYHNGSIWTDLSNSAIYSGVTEATLLATGVDNTLAELNGATGDFLGVSIRCVVTSNGCDINTGEDHLYIHVEPSINTQPKDFVECVNAGDTRSTTMFPILTLSDSGMPFQWEYDDGTGFVNISDNAVYSGTNQRILTFTGANADYNGMYRVKISNCAATVYSDEAAFTLDEKPAITLQPVNAQIEVCEGEIVEYTVTATGNNLTYQWQWSGSDISDDAPYSGTDSPTLTIDTKDFGDFSGYYQCVISSNVSCSTTSSRGNLRVYQTPSFSGAPGDKVACEGVSSVEFIKGASNFISAVHTYQWQEAFAGTDIFVDITDGEKFAGTNGVTLSVKTPTYTMNGNKYRISVVGCETPVYSDAATLTVNQLPLITTSPQSQSVCKGEEVIFTAKSEIGTDVTYQWMVDDGSGYTSASAYLPAGDDGFSTLTISAQATDNGNKYKCVARSANPCTTDQISESTEATLVVNEVTIQTNPVSVAICNGESTAFNIDVLGEGLTYQWYGNGTALTDEGVYTGVNTNMLTIAGASNLTMDASITYTCEVEGTCGVVSASANLTIFGTDKPIISGDFNNAESPTLSVTNVFGDAYEWFLNGTALGSRGSSFAISQEGSYTVITTSNGCDSEESEAFVILVTGTANKLTNRLQIFPNPVKDNLVIVMAEEHEDSRITVSGLDGKVIYQESVVGIKTTIDMEGLKAGIYLIQIHDNQGVSIHKVIKK